MISSYKLDNNVTSFSEPRTEFRNEFGQEDVHGTRTSRTVSGCGNISVSSYANSRDAIRADADTVDQQHAPTETVFEGLRTGSHASYIIPKYAVKHRHREHDRRIRRRPRDFPRHPISGTEPISSHYKRYSSINDLDETPHRHDDDSSTSRGSGRSRTSNYSSETGRSRGRRKTTTGRCKPPTVETVVGSQAQSNYIVEGKGYETETSSVHEIVLRVMSKQSLHLGVKMGFGPKHANQIHLLNFVKVMNQPSMIGPHAHLHLTYPDLDLQQYRPHRSKLDITPLSVKRHKSQHQHYLILSPLHLPAFNKLVT